MRIALYGRLEGGVGVYARSLVAGLLAADPTIRIELVTPDRPTGVEADARLEVRVVDGRALRPLPTHPGWILEAASYGRRARASAGIDLRHFVDARTALFAPGTAPRVGTMNDDFYAAASDLATLRRIYRDWAPRWGLYRLTRAAERHALRRLERGIAIARTVAERTTSAYGLDPSRWDVVPMGFDHPTVRRDQASDGAPRRVLFVGGNFQRKGLRVLIDAAPEVVARHPNVRFLVAGRSFGAGELRRRARRRGVAASFEFLGGVSHARLWELYAAADVFTMPSLLEAFGIPYLEAMSCGLPVVASATAGPAEYLRDGENAIVVATGDAPALARGLLRALEDVELRRRLDHGGRETAARFTRERMARETLAVYRKALGSR